MATVFLQINDKIREQKTQINYLHELLKIEKAKLKMLKKLQVDIKDNYEVESGKVNPALHKWNKMSISEKLDSALPYDRDNEPSELYDNDSATNSKPPTVAELDKELDDYFKSDMRKYRYEQSLGCGYNQRAYPVRHPSGTLRELYHH